jgi:hypothetical protein
MQYGPKIATNGLVLALDAADMNSYSPNVHPNSIDIYAWAINGGSTSCTITRDSSQTRQYGSKPMKMAVTGNDPYIITINYGPGASSIWNLAPAVNGQTWTISVYVKASVATTGELFLMPADSNGVVITSASGAINITTSWTRVSFTYTISSANCAYIQCRLDGPNTGGSGINIWWDGLQVERSSTATKFNPYYYGNTYWKDISGNANNGNFYGPTFSADNIGSIVFNGVDDYISVSNPASLNPGLSSFTIDAWVYQKDNGYNGIVDARGANLHGFLCLLNYTTAGTVAFFLNTTTDVDQNIYYSTVATFTDVLTWMNVSVVVNRSANNITFYKNGIQQGAAVSITSGGSVDPGSGYLYYIGGDLGGPEANINLSTIKQYNRALSAQEILQNYRALKARFGL